MSALRRTLATAVLAGGALLAGLGTAPDALAHAKVKSTSPASGATVRGTLTEVSVTFDEAVDLIPNALRITTDLGIPIQLETSRLSANQRVLSAQVQDHLAPGHYAVAWRIMADDGHVESDSFPFSVAGAAGAPAATAAATPPPSSPGEPLWPVFVAIGVAVVGGAGAGLVVRRGLRIAAAEGSAPYDHSASPGRHPSSRLPM